jgi:hypothetical protein
MSVNTTNVLIGVLTIYLIRRFYTGLTIKIEDTSYGTLLEMQDVRAESKNIPSYRPHGSLAVKS